MESWELTDIRDGFELRIDGKTLIHHTKSRPWLATGSGNASYRMYRGNFRIGDKTGPMATLPDFTVSRGTDSVEIRFSNTHGEEVVLRVFAERGPRRGPEDSGRRDLPGGRGDAESLVVEFVSGPEGANRWRLFLVAEPGERAYGCGEQFSHFDLRGRKFPLWTSEQGVGRNKWTLTTRMADLVDGAGGDYFWTFFPQPSYSTNRRIRVHLETSAWSEFDFRPARHFILNTRQKPERLVFGSAPRMEALAAETARWFGLQPKPPEWIHDGVVLGIQGGTDTCLAKLDAARKAGVPVSGIWAQDWAGVRHTGFGKRLSWNWELDPSLYPDLGRTCAALETDGVRFMAYVNCYFACDKPIFGQLERLGLLVRNRDGGAYRMDAGEFEAGIPDLTNPAARTWFKDLIRRNLLSLGISGWMADFGEYLPADCVLFDGTPAEIAHNLWPALWARVNYEALEESNALDRATFFMRAGYAGSQRWCPLMWAGDQNVDWSKDDGLPSVIPAALSLAMVGHGFHHSDIGGYTTLYGMKRTKELFLRWAELAAFTVMMRTHEGNRPEDNWQFDSDAGTLAGLGRMGRLRTGLAPYFKALSAECAAVGTPVIRPLFFVDEDDPRARRETSQFMLGPDLLVAPVLRKGARRRRVRLVAGEWVQLWSGKRFSGRRWIESDAPLGEPPAYWRAGSTWEPVFREAVRSAREE
ncbi:MAG: alpha-glucosidase [Spirochaetes bacterium]|nr:alpha-glucosidase [Spirochaetota bacterium]